MKVLFALALVLTTGMAHAQNVPTEELRKLFFLKHSPNSEIVDWRRHVLQVTFYDCERKTGDEVGAMYECLTNDNWWPKIALAKCQQHVDDVAFTLMRVKTGKSIELIECMLYATGQGDSE